MRQDGLLGNLLNKGELPTVKTEVAIEKESIDYLAVMLALVAVIAIVVNAIAKRV